MRKKMSNLLGFVDLICFKFFNIGNWSADINPENGHKWGPRGLHGSEFGMYLTTILSKIFFNPKDPNFG